MDARARCTEWSKTRCFFVFVGITVIVVGALLCGFTGYAMAHVESTVVTFDCVVLSVATPRESCGEYSCSWVVAVTVVFGVQNDTATDTWAYCGVTVLPTCNATYVPGKTMTCFVSTALHQFVVSPDGNAYDGKRDLILTAAVMGFIVGVFLVGITALVLICTRNDTDYAAF
jgi:hypothetical protein